MFEKSVGVQIMRSSVRDRTKSLLREFDLTTLLIAPSLWVNENFSTSGYRVRRGVVRAGGWLFWNRIPAAGESEAGVLTRPVVRTGSWRASCLCNATSADWSVSVIYICFNSCICCMAKWVYFSENPTLPFRCNKARGPRKELEAKLTVAEQ